MGHHKQHAHDHDKHHHDKHKIDKKHHSHDDDKHHKKALKQTLKAPAAKPLGQTREQLIALRHELEKVQREMHAFFDQSVHSIRHQQLRLNERLKNSVQQLPDKKQK